MEGSLLQRIYDLGEELSSALSRADLEAFFELVEKRGTLLDKLTRYAHPFDVDPDWKIISEALKEQHRKLATAVAGEQKKMQDVLTELERFKGASRSYQGSASRSQILSEDLRV